MKMTSETLFTNSAWYEVENGSNGSCNMVFNSGPQLFSGPSIPKHAVKVHVFSKDLIDKCIFTVWICIFTLWIWTYLLFIDNFIFTVWICIFTLWIRTYLLNVLKKTRTFTACFGIEGPLRSCGPELKTKLHDPFEPFSTSYHALLVNRVSEVIFIN